MKQVINIIDHITKTKDGKPKVIKHEIEVRDYSHLQAQINNPSHTFKPKKGKGSFRRKSKYNNLEEN